MYFIHKYCLKAVKLPWLIDLYFRIDPKCFAPQQSKEACQAILQNIAAILECSDLRWRRGWCKLSKIKDIVVSSNQIMVYYKSGKPCLVFVIKEFKEQSV